MTRVAAAADAHPELAAVAQCRLDAAKSSTAKLQRINYVRGPGELLRGMIAYYGASRTGRYAGRLCQPHNYPRGYSDDEFDDAVTAFLNRSKDSKAGDRTLTHISNILRGTMVPREGNTHLIVGDFSQIEARVIAWIAGQQDILDVFAKGEDVYTYAAKRIGSDSRTLGKVMTLGLGFQMGGDRFRDTAKTYGLDLTLTEAEDNVGAWRANNYAIVQLWTDLDRAVRRAITAITTPKPIAVGEYLKVGTGDINGTRSVYIQLPSGRRLWYYNAKMRQNDDPVLPFNINAPVIAPIKSFNKTVISYHSQNTMTNKWGVEHTYGGKLAENVTQAIARDVMARCLYHLNSAANHIDACLPLLTVHDEVICDIDDNLMPKERGIDHVKGLMTKQPKWAPGLPIDAEVFSCERYRK
jgi:DNA polymerase